MVGIPLASWEFYNCFQVSNVLIHHKTCGFCSLTSIYLQINCFFFLFQSHVHKIMFVFLCTYSTIPRTHLPAMIRISSDESPSKTTQQRPTSQLVNGKSAVKPMKAFKDSSSKRTSLSSSGSSPDSACSGGKFNFENGSDMVWQKSSLGNLSNSTTGSDTHSSPTHEPVVVRSSRKSSADSGELTEVNRWVYNCCNW